MRTIERPAAARERLQEHGIHGGGRVRRELNGAHVGAGAANGAANGAAHKPALAPSLRRRLIERSRSTSCLEWPDLDRLLVGACRSAARLQALARDLRGIEIVEPEDGDDIFKHRLDSSVYLGIGHDYVSLYSERVRALPRLTRDQEHRLARRLEFARELLSLELGALELPEGAVEAVLRAASRRALNAAMAVAEAPEGSGARAHSACRLFAELRAHFVERNLHIVVGMASAYRTYGLPPMDLIQEGNASLIRAVEKFDWRKDVRFQTYAAFWVRQAIERLITANRGIVRVPNYVQQKMRRLRREGKLPRNHREMDFKEVSQLFDTSAEGAVRLMATDRNWYSLDVSPADGEATFGSMLSAEEDDGAASLSPSERLLLAKRLDEVLEQHLTAQERDILSQRFGLRGELPKTLDQIGAQMSVSRERIRQMQVKALGKLQKRGLRESLEDFL